MGRPPGSSRRDGLLGMGARAAPWIRAVASSTPAGRALAPLALGCADPRAHHGHRQPARRCASGA
eukprot:14404773-Alexandrium_andersonii.AAC.1